MDKAHAPKYLFTRSTDLFTRSTAYRQAPRSYTTPMLVAEGTRLVVKQPKKRT